MENQFKLIAIEPLDGCEKHIVKNLRIGKKYFFYQGYVIGDNDSIAEIETVPLHSDFFQKGRLGISVHAIVGRNGSGKSAIIELLMRTINNLSFIHNGADLGQFGVVPIFGVAVNLYFQVANQYYKIHLFKLEDKLSVKATIKRLNVEAEEKDINNAEFKRQIAPFFYTILNNYSLYAYNIKDYDKEKIDWTNTQNSGINTPNRDWINGICHKNDGYSTPIVVNPMRTEGNININTETDLTRSRLLSLLVEDEKSSSFRSFNLGEGVKRSINSISFNAPVKLRNYSEINHKEIGDPKEFKHKFQKFIPDINFRTSLWSTEFQVSTFKEFSCSILRQWGAKWDIEELKKEITFEEINDTIEYNYVVAKTMDIINKYSPIICPEGHSKFYTMSVFSTKQSNEFIEERVESHVSSIFNDSSHISLKIKQALNYIKHTGEIYRHYSVGNGLTVAKFSEAINKMKSQWGEESSNILYFMPPSFVNFEIYYSDDNSNEIYPFKFLSSGEKQLTYFITTILYHLRNLDSAFNSIVDRAKYEYVNIILEEIELYFHPEMQRVMVNSLIRNIRDMDYTHIRAVDICLVTHSPIILSDIPTQNILFLESGEPKDVEENTFGANIHSLYKHSFFMDMPMGEFARTKIDKLIKQINYKHFSKMQQELGKQTSKIVNAYLEESQVDIVMDLDTIIREVNLIGEPIIRQKLLSMIDLIKSE